MAVYKKVFSVTVYGASEADLDREIEDIIREMDSGDLVGTVAIESLEEVPADKLRAELLAIGNDGEFFADLTAGPLRVMAQVHSDDFAVESSFDATPWFEQASADDIKALCVADWGGDYPADDVARFMSDRDKGCERVFDYVYTRPTIGSGNNTVGFECHVNADQAIRWLEANRPEIYAALGL